jgi:succinate-semialdehyde dehydrogenase / glutarate-semialdehyde dehydrogenase
MDVIQFLDQPTIGFFANGQFSSTNRSEACELVSACNHSTWKRWIPADARDTELAIDSAQTAFKVWKRTPSPERARYLRKIGDLILEYKQVFAEVMAHEMGKPVSQGLGEASYAAGYFHWFAGEAERIYGMTIPSQFPNKELKILYEPIGVAAAITPWNFPLAMAARKIAAALAAGCTILNKPSSESPITMLLFAQLCQMAHLPPGVVSIIPGASDEIGNALLQSPIVRKISFTGSTEVGMHLYRKSAGTLKKLTMELGGHAPLIVFKDADVEKAVEGAIAGKFRNNGQTCVCPNRMFIERAIYPQFIEKMVQGTSKLIVGDPLDPDSDLSPILHPSAEKKTARHIKDAIQKGANAELKGSHPYNPCVLSGVNETMDIYREETFGPVAALIPFDTEKEAITRANDTPFGLAAYLYTENLSRASRVANALEYGIIGINDPIPSTYQASFGGIKYSGFGREGGPSGIREYLAEKYLSYEFAQ